MKRLACERAWCSAVEHWNAWFDGMIPMSDRQNHPMQSYLQTVVVNLDMRQLGGIDPRMLVFVSDRALRAVQILIATVSILKRTRSCSSISSQE